MYVCTHQQQKLQDNHMISASSGISFGLQADLPADNPSHAHRMVCACALREDLMIDYTWYNLNVMTNQPQIWIRKPKEQTQSAHMHLIEIRNHWFSNICWHVPKNQCCFGCLPEQWQSFRIRTIFEAKPIIIVLGKSSTSLTSSNANCPQSSVCWWVSKWSSPLCGQHMLYDVSS